MRVLPQNIYPFFAKNYFDCCGKEDVNCSMNSNYKKLNPVTNNTCRKSVTNAPGMGVG